jgi:hypothetical protein
MGLPIAINILLLIIIIIIICNIVYPALFDGPKVIS